MENKTEILEEKVLNNEALKKDVVQKANKYANNVNILKKVGMVAGGVLAGTAVMGFVSRDTANAQNIGNQGGTDEHNPAADSANEVVVIHDVAPIAQNVSDDMTFDDAFAIARQEVGPGGAYKWHGQWYGTYTEAEWQSMDADDIAKYQNSISQLPELEPYHPNPSQPEIITIEAEVFLDSKEVILEDGNTVHLAFFKQGNEVVTKMDVDGDGEYDYIYDIESGMAIGLNGNPDVRINLAGQDNPTPEPDPDEPLKIEFEVIEGIPAKVEYYADGHVKVHFDQDNDGSYDDMSIFMSADGKTADYYIYDENGNIIEQGPFPIEKTEPEPTPFPSPDEPQIISVEDVEQDGIQGQLITYSDGTQAIKVDLDGNGQYDYIGTLNDEGEVIWYDMDGNLINLPEPNPYIDPEPIYDPTIDPTSNIVDINGLGDDFNNNIDTNDWTGIA